MDIASAREQIEESEHKMSSIQSMLDKREVELTATQRAKRRQSTWQTVEKELGGIMEKKEWQKLESASREDLLVKIKDLRKGLHKTKMGWNEKEVKSFLSLSLSLSLSIVSSVCVV